MHILIISHGYPTVKDPQWGCFEKDQAEALAGMGHRVTVAVVDMRFRTSNQTFGISHINDGAISAYTNFLLPGKLIPSRMKRFVAERMMLQLCRKIFRAEGMPDVIYAHYMFCIAMLRQVKQKYAIPIVGIEHWSELNKSTLPPKLMQTGRTAYALTDRLLAVSPSLQAQMERHFGVEAEVVYDMVSDFFLQPIIPEKTAKPFVWLAVGSLIQRKGYDVLLEAFARLERSAMLLGSSKNEEQLIIIGTGTESERLHAQAEQLGIADRVRFTGMLDKQTIVRLMNESNAFVLPSRGETFGVAYIEAMAMGLPVIATPCGGPEHFVTSENGLLVDIDNVDQLTEAMRQMETTVDKYQPKAIRAYVQERFSAKAIAGQLEEIFKKVIKQKNNR